MEREDILKSPEYWTAKTQIELYKCATEFMENAGLNHDKLSKHLGVSKECTEQLLNGDYDNGISTFFKIALSLGYVPNIKFVPITEFIESNKP